MHVRIPGGHAHRCVSPCVSPCITVFHLSCELPEKLCNTTNVRRCLAVNLEGIAEVVGVWLLFHMACCGPAIAAYTASRV